MDRKKLDRIHRVRTMQLNLVRAAEAEAHAKVESEFALRARIAQLAAGVAPQPSAAEGISFAAAAIYRERLHMSAQAAEQRVANASARVQHATAATRAARQDQHAVEKLIERDDAAEALRQLRALEAAPPSRVIRHDPLLMTAAMMTSTFLDLGLSPAPSGVPGAPPAVAAGVAVPDFATAMAGLLGGAPPEILTKGVTSIRQDVAVVGKNVPATVGAMPLIAPDFPDGVMPDSEPLPKLAPTESTPAQDGKSAPAEPVEPEFEPALAWLMPPPPPAASAPTPVVVPTAPAAGSLRAPGVIMSTAVALPTDDPVSAPAQPAASAPLTVAPTGSGDMPADPSQPLKAAPVGEQKRPADQLRPADAPVDPIARQAKVAAATQPVIEFLSRASAASTVVAAPVMIPVMKADVGPPVAAPAADGAPLMQGLQRELGLIPKLATTEPAQTVLTGNPPTDTATPALPWLQRTNAPAKTAAGTAREPLAAIPDTQLRAATTQRVEIQPVPVPARDSGAILAAAAAIRAAPAIAVGFVDTPTSSNPATSPLDLGALAPVAAGAPVAQPVSAPQQAGIDLTHDQGMHRMIDRIEHLRDAFDARDTRIRLIPDALGPVDISVRRDAASDAVQVHFTAAEAGTRQLIADAQQRLVDLADSRGVRIERATVDSGTGNGTGQQTWTGDGQPRQQQQAHTPQPARSPARAARDADPESTDQRIA